MYSWYERVKKACPWAAWSGEAVCGFGSQDQFWQFDVALLVSIAHFQLSLDRREKAAFA